MKKISRTHWSSTSSAAIHFLRYAAILFCLLGLLFIGGMVSAQSPLHFEHGGDRTIDHGDTVELPLVAQNLQDVESIQFTVHWNPYVLEFLDLSSLDTTRGITLEDIGFSETYLGRLFLLSINFQDPISIPDGDTLMTLQLKATGIPDEQTIFGVQDFPLNLQAISGGSLIDFQASRINVEIEAPETTAFHYRICPAEQNTDSCSISVSLFGDAWPADFYLIDSLSGDTLLEEQFAADTTLEDLLFRQGTFFAEIRDSVTLYQRDTFTYEPLDTLSFEYFTEDASCPQNRDGAIVITETTGGAGVKSIVWSSGDLFDPTHDSIGPGTYPVEIIDENKCQLKEEIEVAGPQLIAQEIIGQASCENATDGTLEVNVLNRPRFEDSTLLFSLNGSDFNRNINLRILSTEAGPFTYYVQDTLGCIFEKTVTIPWRNDIQLSNIVKINPRCPGTNDGQLSGIAQLNINETGSFTFDWSGGSETIVDSFFLAVGIPADTFTLEVGHTGLPANCNLIDTFVFEQSDSLNVQADPLIHESCRGAGDGLIEIEVAGGTPPYSYEWSNGSESRVIDQLVPGRYRLTVTDFNFCSEVVDFIIDSGAVLEVLDTEIQNAACHGDSSGRASIQVGLQNAPDSVQLFYSLNGSDTLNWDSSGTQTITDLPAGNYSLAVFSPQIPCRIDTSWSVSQPDSLKISLEELVNADCNASNGKIRLTASGGLDSNYTFQWDTGADSSTLDQIPNGTYSVTLSNSAGCQTSRDFLLEPPIASSWREIQLTHNECPGDSTGEIALIPDTTQSPIIDIQWSNGDTGTILDQLPGGIYRVTFTNADLCSDTLELSISEPDSFQFDFETQPDTADRGVGQATVIVEGGTPPYEYIWNTFPIQTTPTATQLESGNYQVLVIDDNGCRASATVFVDGTTSARPAYQTKSVLVYPNPTHGRVYLESDFDQPMMGYRIISSDGRLLKERNFPPTTAGKEIDLKSSGTYLIQVLFTDGAVFNSRWIVRQ